MAKRSVFITDDHRSYGMHAKLVPRYPHFKVDHDSIKGFFPQLRPSTTTPGCVEYELNSDILNSDVLFEE